jgi:hypothetical protein
MKPDVRVLKCLRRLQEPEFAPLLEGLQVERQRQLELLAATNGEAMCLYQLQGRARALGDLLRMIETATETLTKLEKS